VAATEEITLDAGASQKVTLTTTRSAAGTYAVTVDGLSGTLEVKPPPVLPPSPKPTNWWLISGIIAAAIVVSTVVWLLVIRRRS
jgi:hypothetical protein